MPETHCPESNYLTRSNIVHPLSTLPGTQGDARVAADEVRGRAEMATRAGGVSVSGGAIVKGR